MEKPIIVVSWWKVYARRLFDSVKRPFSRLLWRIRAVGYHKGPRVKVNRASVPTENEGPPNLTRRRILRIKARPSPIKSLELLLPPKPPDSTRVGRLKRRQRDKNINVTEGLQLCKACGEAIDNGKELAHCRRDSGHTIHKNCVPFMKHKCPHCGGPIS
jgi:hypothetical protein